VEAVTQWRVYGYTRQQLNDAAAEGEVSGWDRDGEARTLEMAAHLIANGCEFIILQKQGGEQ
jgi:hypothetical protein